MFLFSGELGGRLIFIHLQCWEVLLFFFSAIQRQRRIKFRVLRAQDFYTPLALNCQKRQHLPALEVYKNHSPIRGHTIPRKLRSAHGANFVTLLVRGGFYPCYSGCRWNGMPLSESKRSFWRTVFLPPTENRQFWRKSAKILILRSTPKNKGFCCSIYLVTRIAATSNRKSLATAIATQKKSLRLQKHL